MKRIFTNRAVLFFFVSLALSGCQSANVQPAALSREVKSVPNVPYTRGPTSPPGVKGPGQALPSQQPSQSVTK